MNWKKLAIIFLSIHFLACILYFSANNVTLLLIVRFIHGLGFGASANAIVTIASAILPKKRFAEAFGYFMLGTTIAVGLGPYISGFFYDHWGALGSFGLATAFSAIALLCILILDIGKYDLKSNDDNEEIADIENVSDSVEDESKYGIIDKIFEVPAIPVSLFTGLTSLGYVSILSFYRLYAVGGRDGSSCLKSVECFDPHTNKWTLCAQMSKRRGGVGVTTWNGLLYAIGGHDAPASNLTSRLSDCVERYLL
jgi:MFS family permease